MDKAKRLRELISDYVPLEKLKQFATEGTTEHKALLDGNMSVPEVDQLLSCIRAVFTPKLNRTQIKTPADAAVFFMAEMGFLEKEELRVMVLDGKNRVMTWETVYVGSVNSVQVRIGEVIRPVIKANGSAFIVVHNHPSGDVTPSPEDIVFTRQVVEIGKTIDAECIDHVIVGKGRFRSMRELGHGF